MNELRVALFTGNYNHIRDGVSLTLNRLVKYLEDQGIPVLVFGPSIENPPVDHAGELVVTPSIPMMIGGRVEYRYATSFPDWAQKRLEDFKPSIIHIATPDGLGKSALKYAKEHNLPVVSSYHTHFLSYVNYYIWFSWILEAWVKWQMRKFYGAVDHTYVPSESMIEVIKSVGVQGDLRLWARGIDLELFNPEKRNLEWRRSLDFEDDDIVITFVSRLVWEKELRTYIESVKNLQKKYPKVKALIVGDGPAKEEAERLLPDGRFIGFAKGEELARAYASSDVFLFPSHTETFGNVTLEAMASGLPCVVADAIGSKSLVNDGENGFWANQSDVPDFTQKLERIVSDDNLREKMGKKSRELALNYRWEDINAGLVENYKELINK